MFVDAGRISEAEGDQSALDKLWRGRRSGPFAEL